MLRRRVVPGPVLCSLRLGPARNDAASNSPDIRGISPVSTETVARSGVGRSRAEAEPAGRRRRRPPVPPAAGSGAAAQPPQQGPQQVAKFRDVENLQQEQ